MMLLFSRLPEYSLFLILSLLVLIAGVCIGIIAEKTMSQFLLKSFNTSNNPNSNNQFNTKKISSQSKAQSSQNNDLQRTFEQVTQNKHHLFFFLTVCFL